MWRDIFLSNKDAVLDVVNDFKEKLHDLENALKNEDGEEIVQCLTSSKQKRAEFGTVLAKRDRRASLNLMNLWHKGD